MECANCKKLQEQIVLINEAVGTASEFEGEWAGNDLYEYLVNQIKEAQEN